MAASPKSLGEFDAIFFISLPRAIERRRSIQQQIERFDLKNAIIVDAVDGRLMDCQEARKSGVVADGKQLARPLHPGEIGCMLSHRNVWQQFLDEEMDSALIFEDDAVLRDDCCELGKTVLAQVPDDWDVIYLHSHFPVGSGQGCDSGRKKISENVYRAFQEHGGAAGYALSGRRGAAEYLIERSTPVSYPADGVTNWLSADWDNRDWKAYTCWPFLVDTPAVASTIWNNGKVSLLSHLSKKIWYKLTR
jgi:glycosyl transferase family 25